MSRNTLKLDVSGFKDMVKKFAHAGGNAQRLVEESLNEASKKITQDTYAALSPGNLPAQGKYSTGTTKESVIQDASVSWSGLTAEIPVGFDFSKPGAGGFLITGTPRMQPDKELNRIYKQKKYMNEIQKQMADKVLGAIVKQMVED